MLFIVNFVLTVFVGVYFSFVRGQDGTVIGNMHPDKFNLQKLFEFGGLPGGRETAAVEQESFVSQLDTKYGRALNGLGHGHGPQPIVDTIAEYEKYGNDGGPSRKVATGLINGFEGLANVVNKILDAPTNAQSQVGKGITAALNRIGGTLVGL